MGFWTSPLAAPTIGAIGNVASSIFGSKGGSSLADRHFAEDQYWRGVDQSEKNWTRDMNMFLGSGNAYNYYAPNDQNRIGPVAIGTAAGELAEKGLDMIGRERDLDFSGRHLQQAFDIGAENGLTPQELAGSPVPGGTQRSGGNASLGNNGAQAVASRNAAQSAALDRRTTLEVEAMRANTQVKTAQIGAQASMLGTAAQAGVQLKGQQVDMTRAELQSETQKQVSKISAAANIKSSKIHAAAQVEATKIVANATKYTADTNRLNVLGSLKLQGDVNDAQIAKMAAETALVMQDQGFKKDLHDERWSKLFASMGPENVAASALAVKYGVPIEDVLKGQNIDEQTMQQLDQFLRHQQSSKSYLWTEIVGIDQTIGQAGQKTGRTLKDVGSFLNPFD
jgi:hypothetical protein